MEGVGRVSEAGAGEVGVCVCLITTQNIISLKAQDRICNSSHTMVTAAGATRLLYRHQKSMHCIYTQIL